MGFKVHAPLDFNTQIRHWFLKIKDSVGFFLCKFLVILPRNELQNVVIYKLQ